MQNHSAYSGAWTNLPKEVWLTGEMEGKYNTVNQYLNLIYQSDKAFEYLINYFSQVEEPTMILMFGDHQPQVATNFYTEVLGGAFDTLDAGTAQRRQKVPFVLWANYDIPEEQGTELSLNYLSSLLLETAGLPRTGYQQFLSALRETVPAVNGVGYRDADGAWYKRRSELLRGRPGPACSSTRCSNTTCSLTTKKTGWQIFLPCRNRMEDRHERRFYMPGLSHFENDNGWSGSRGCCATRSKSLRRAACGR